MCTTPRTPARRVGDPPRGSRFLVRITPPATTTLPSGLVHTSSVDYGDAAAKYRLLERQTLSLSGMLAPIAKRLYPEGGAPDPAYSLDQAARDLISAVEAHSAFTLTPEQARRVLSTSAEATQAPAGGAANTPRRAARRPIGSPRVLRADPSPVGDGRSHEPAGDRDRGGPARLGAGDAGYYHTTDVGRFCSRHWVARPARGAALLRLPLHLVEQRLQPQSGSPGPIAYSRRMKRPGPAHLRRTTSSTVSVAVMPQMSVTVSLNARTS